MIALLLFEISSSSRSSSSNILLLRAMSRRDGQRSAVRSQEGWFCKNCDDRYRNFAFRRSCNRCGRSKGRCFAGTASPASSTGPATTLAQRQISAQKAAERSQQASRTLSNKDKEIAALKRQLAGQQQANLQKVDEDMGTQGDETPKDAAASWEEGASMEQLEARKKFLASQGDNEGVRTCEAKIQARRFARDSQLPLHVRMEKAAKETKRNQTLVDGAGKKAARQQKELSVLQEQIQAHDERLAAAKAELAEAQRKEKELCEQPARVQEQPKESGNGCFDGALAAFALMDDKELAEIGHDRETVQALLGKSAEIWSARLARRSIEKEAEVAKIQAENAAALALAAGASGAGGVEPDRMPGPLSHGSPAFLASSEQQHAQHCGFESVEDALSFFDEDADEDCAGISTEVKRKLAKEL